ncbi:MAG TPA: hypothetical protein VMB51_15690 [Solirubrobacteraceae bacterium]|nr:hypothetical protein [Solirubrobacteraceae bacterium]
MLATSIAMVLLAIFAGTASSAEAATPWWTVITETAPTQFSPGAEGLLDVAAENLGGGEIDGTSTITDRLPAGVSATRFTGSVTQGGTGPRPEPKCSASGEVISCTYDGPLAPYERFQVEIDVAVSAALTPGAVTNSVSVEGGGASKTTSTEALSISSEPVPFGLRDYSLAPTVEAGAPATEAGSHPFQLTTSLVFNQISTTFKREPAELPRDMRFTLPPGLIGDPTAVEQCSEANFTALYLETDLCQPSSVVGVALVTVNEPRTIPITKLVPVFNLVPSVGEPARFGFTAAKVPIVLDTSVNSEGGYNVVASVNNLSQTAGILSSEVTLWGVPGAAGHNGSRGWECIAEGFYESRVGRPCPATSVEPERPFLTLPTSCATDPAAEPVLSTVQADSWLLPEKLLTSEYAWINGEGEPLGYTGCGQLRFAPSMGVVSEQHSGSTPTGLSVDVKTPQKGLLEAGGVAEANLRDTTVALPEGVQLSPSAANGLAACSEGSEDGYEGIGFEGFAKIYGPDAEPAAETATFKSTFRFAEEETEGQKLKPSCPEASKLGTVHIRTPLLSHQLEGSVYLASPAPNGEAGRNPFNSLVALYLVAEDREAGILVKLAGRGEVNESTGQITTTFSDSPQVPFEELKLELFGGSRASLATPARCGNYATSGVFTPWSGTGPVTVSSGGEEFAVNSGVDGSGCPGGALPFGPGFAAKNTNTAAGGFTSFELELSRPDGDQALDGVTMHLPEGVAALLSSVELCSAAQADATACPAASQIGEATAVAGLGPEPYVQSGGRVYITGPYDGAPFGLDIVTPADAGPFDLGYISVRSKLEVNPENASVTVASDPLPTEIRGIPLQLKRVLVDVNRAGFEFNPTSCAAQRDVQGTLAGAEGGSWSGSSPYPVTGCANLPFKPTLTAAAVGHGSKADGTTFKVVVTSGGVGANGVVQAGIAKVDVQLPKQLSSRLPTLQKACTEAAFAANPASCPEGSVIGAATIRTPVLKSALAGPAYLVSHGNAAFPDLEFVLQGEDIELVLDGKTQIKDGVTYSKFESAPDAPFTTFETVLPAGPHGVLTPNVAESKHFDLCGETLEMPTTIVAQNGATIEHDTRIAIQGCAAVKAARTKKLTNAEKLAKALAACRTRNRHAKRRRLACEKQVRRRYVAKEAGHKHKPRTAKDRRKG